MAAAETSWLFDLLFALLCLLCAALYYVQWLYWRGGPAAAGSGAFRKFQASYLSVYVCAVMGDWLQGPYIYALYAAYGFEPLQIAVLFLVGFGASGALGAFAGELADRFGRRLSCYVYCITYIVSCLSKHSSSFHVLLFGRLTGGLATSILFSSFESWLVSEHTTRGFPPQLLSQTLSLATLLNYVAAIFAAGVAAIVSTQFDSLVAPFDLAVVFLSIAMACIAATWPENRGETAESRDAAAGGAPARHGGRSKLAEAVSALRADHRIVLLGLIQSCFEAAMYIFVFMWTPKLEGLFQDLPHGQVFGCFMACCMMGSGLVSFLLRLRGSPIFYMREHLLLSALCLTLPGLFPSSGALALACFFFFEAAVGVYWPSMGILKSQHVPEQIRATIYNLFRVPLNMLVVLVLLNLGVLSDDAVFIICGGLLAAAALLQHFFASLVRDGASHAAESAQEEGLEAGDARCAGVRSQGALEGRALKALREHHRQREAGEQGAAGPAADVWLAEESGGEVAVSRADAREGDGEREGTARLLS